MATNTATMAPAATEQQKSLAKRQAGMILGDSQMKALLEFFDIKPKFTGICDSKGNTYFHLKLFKGDKQIADEQYCDVVDGKFNNVGTTIGKSYISYRMADIRKALMLAVLKRDAIDKGIIDPDADLFDVEEMEVVAPANTVTASNADNAVF